MIGVLFDDIARWFRRTGFSGGRLPGRTLRGYWRPVGTSWKKRGRVHLKKRGKRILSIDNKTGEVEVVHRKDGRLMKNSKYNRGPVYLTSQEIRRPRRTHD